MGGEACWEAAWRAEDETVQQGWGASADLEGWRRWAGCLIQRCLEDSVDLSDT